MNEIRARTIEISERCKILTENDDEVIKIEALITSILVHLQNRKRLAKYPFG